MTSSLVGSEMCIRDSPLVGAFSGAPCWSSLSNKAAIPSVNPKASLPVAVSYTHLTLPTICSV
eukprot:6596253-Prorocentrum_lima.AAC.1